MPVFSSGLQIQADGNPLVSIMNRIPGVAVASFGSRLYENRNTLDYLGKRLLEFANLDSEFPKINEAWCTATYWYHQALAEPIETIRIIKLVTAIEIRLRTENTQGSQGKIAEAIERVTGLNSNEKIKGDKTVGQFAKLIVQTRSQVLHGTYPTFASSDKMASFDDVE